MMDCRHALAAGLLAGLLSLAGPAGAAITFPTGGHNGTSTSGVADISCPLPSGIQPNDIGIWHTLSEDTVNHTYPTAQGWNKVAQTNQGTVLTHSWAWKRFSGGEIGSVTVAISGITFKQCRISLWRGVRISGNPYGALGTPTQGTVDPVNPPAVTANVNDMIVGLIAVGDDNTLAVPTTGTGVGTVSLAYQVKINASTQGALAATYATATTTGSVDLSSPTMNDDPWVAHSIALVPLACGAVSEASYVAATAQSGRVTVYWSSANPVVILRKQTATITDAPATGVTYTAGAQPWGTGTSNPYVLYDGTNAMAGATCTATSCTDTGVTDGTTYYYKVFPRSSAEACYAAGTGVEVSVKPDATTTGVAWSYALAGGSMLKAGIAGEGTLHTSSMAKRIISLNTADGTQTWAPLNTNEVIQSWLTWLPGAAGAGWYNPSWTARKRIRIDRTKVGSGGVTNFPVLISLTDAGLKNKAQASGNDILFTSADGTTKLSHEIERYTSSTGELIAWVKVPSISSTADTDLYMYYGNAAATNQENATDVWSNGYVGVWHLKETPTGAAGEIRDSTPNAGHGTSLNMASTDQVPGKIGGALKFKSDMTPPGSVVDTQDRAVMQLPTYSWSMWIRGDTAPTCPSPPQGNEQPIWNADAQFNFSWGHTGCGFMQAAAHSETGTSTWRSAKIQTTLFGGTWYHIAATSGSGNLKIYLNGVLEQTTAHGAPATSTGSFAIGNGVGFTRWAGQLDEVRVGNVVRSDAWILTESNNQSSPGTFSSVGAENTTGVVIGGDQSGRLYSVDTATWATNWTPQNLSASADFFQATSAAQLWSYANAAFRAVHSGDLIFAGSRNAGATDCGTSTTNNKLLARRASDGLEAWTFNKAVSGVCPNPMDWIVGMPYVDYARNRLYVTSRAGSAGTQTSLWVIDTVNGTMVTPPSPLTLGHLEASPTLSWDGNTIYVGNLAGDFQAVNASTLAVKWTLPLGASAAVKGFVWEDYSIPGRLYFSTGSDVRCVQDNGASGSACAGWTVSAVAGASTLLLLDKIYVGSSDGKLHRIHPSTGVDEKQFPTLTTLDGARVGDVSTETGNEVFVGTEGGRLFKIPLPLP